MLYLKLLLDKEVEKIAATKVAEAMTAKPVTVDPETDDILDHHFCDSLSILNHLLLVSFEFWL